jgi:hypothetical protein
VDTLKKSIPLVLFCLFCSLNALSQSLSSSGKQQDLYAMALAASLSEMQKSWGHLNLGNSGRLNPDYHHMVVWKNPEITDGWPDHFEDYEVEYLDSRGLMDRYDAIHKEFVVLEIHPMRTDGEELKINISASWVSKRKRRLLVGISDWSDVQFKYDPSTHSYVISSVKLGGI